MHSMRLTCVASSSSDLVSDMEDCGKERDIREVRREMCVSVCVRVCVRVSSALKLLSTSGKKRNLKKKE